MRLAGAVLNGILGTGLHAEAALDAVINARCLGLSVLELVDINGAVFDALANTGTLVIVYLYRHISR